jgi:hypothetical protein
VFQNSQKTQVNQSSSDGKKDDEREAKNLKLTANLYTVSFNAFMKSNKEKYKLKQSDQIDVFYRAIFMFIIQVTFVVSILLFETFKW